MPKLTPIAIALLVAAFSGASYSADYYVVVPVKGRMSAAVVTLNAYNLPTGQVGQAYAPFNFNSVLQVSGDSSFTGTGVTWSVTEGALPAGMSLSGTGRLGGTPTIAGTFSFTLTATYAGRFGSQTYQIPVVLVAANATPTSLTFDDTLVGATATSKSVTLTNTGTVALTLQPPLVDSVFSIVSKTCGASLAPSSACQVEVAGAPTAAQTFTGTMALATSAGLFSIPLSVKGYHPKGQVAYLEAATYTFTVPAGVTSLSMVAVGAGGGGTVGYNGAASGGGGALAWVNNVPVTPGESLTVVVGAGAPARLNNSGGTDTDGEPSYVARGGTQFLKAGGGRSAVGSGGTNDTSYGPGGTFSILAGLTGGGGNGGSGAKTYFARDSGGGGAGGYAGNGGRGGGTWSGSANDMASAGNGTGGAASGGSGTDSTSGRGAGGGGTGVYGEGASGLAGVAPYVGQAGTGGSPSGATGTDSVSLGGGGFPGGGGASPISTALGNGGATGAVRIIWGVGRAFPSTRTADE